MGSDCHVSLDTDLLLSLLHVRNMPQSFVQFLPESRKLRPNPKLESKKPNRTGCARFWVWKMVTCLSQK